MCYFSEKQKTCCSLLLKKITCCAKWRKKSFVARKNTSPPANGGYRMVHPLGNFSSIPHILHSSLIKIHRGNYYKMTNTFIAE